MKIAELIFIPVKDTNNTPAHEGAGHLVSAIEFAKLLIDRNNRISITVMVMKLPFARFVDAYTNSVAASQPRIQFINLPDQIHSPSLEDFKKCPEYFALSLSKVMYPMSGKLFQRLYPAQPQTLSELQGWLLISFVLLNLPSYIYFTSNAGFLSLMLYLQTCHDDQFRIPEVGESSDSEILIPGFVYPVPVSVMPPSLSIKDGHSTFIKVAQKFKDIIVNTFSELEVYMVNSFSGGLKPPMYTVGPVLDFKGQPDPEFDNVQWRKILKWLYDQPESSVIFLCFGCMSTSGRDGNLAGAYWLLVPVVFGCRTNHDIFLKGFLERIRGRGTICRWAPQVEVLPHKTNSFFYPN